MLASFSGLIHNTPKGRITTHGRIEHQFKIYGGVIIILIEVKLEIGGYIDHLNCVGQVIAECDGISHSDCYYYESYTLTFYSMLLGSILKLGSKLQSMQSYVMERVFTFLSLMKGVIRRRDSWGVDLSVMVFEIPVPTDFGPRSWYRTICWPQSLRLFLVQRGFPHQDG